MLQITDNVCEKGDLIIALYRISTERTRVKSITFKIGKDFKYLNQVA